MYAPMVIVAIIIATLCSLPQNVAGIALHTMKDVYIQETLVSSLVQAVHKAKSGCLFVLGHDYKTLPSASRLLKQVGSIWGAVTSIQLTDSTPAPQPNTGPGNFEYFFSWLERKTAIHLSNCAVVVLMYHKGNFETLIKHVARVVRVDPRKDLFVYFSPDSDVRSDMLRNDYNFLHQMGLLYESDSVAIASNCHFCDDGRHKVVSSGRYDLKTGISPSGLDLFPDFRDGHQAHLNGSYPIGGSPDELKFMLENDLPVIPYLRILGTVAEAMRFDWHVDASPEVPGGSSETQLPDGNWTGMAGQLVLREVHYAYALGTADVVSVLDIPFNFCTTSITFFRRVPRRLFSWYSIAFPFTPDMWGLVLTTAAVTSIVFLLLLKMSVAKPFDRQPPRSLALYSLRYIFSALIEENPNTIPRPSSLRILIAFWWLFSDLIVCGYEAKFFGFLVSPEMESLPNNLREMVYWPDWQWGVLDWVKPYMEAFISESEVDYHHDIRPKLQNGGDMKTCLTKAIQEDFSCMALPELLLAMAYQALDKEGKIPVQIVDDSSLSMLTGVAFPKYFLLSPLAGRIQMYMNQAGIYNKYSNDFVSSFLRMGLKDARKKDILYEFSMALSVEHMKGSLALMCIFLALSLLIFIAEIVGVRTNGPN